MSISQSEMALIKALIALAWVDGKLSNAERERVHSLTQHAKALSDEQKEELLELVEQPCDLREMWSAIANPQDKAHFLALAEGLIHVDGACSVSGREAIQMLQKDHEESTALKGSRVLLATKPEMTYSYLDDLMRGYYLGAGFGDGLFD